MAKKANSGIVCHHLQTNVNLGLFWNRHKYPGRILKKLAEVVASGGINWMTEDRDGRETGHSINFLKRGWRHYVRREIGFMNLTLVSLVLFLLMS